MVASVKSTLKFVYARSNGWQTAGLCTGPLTVSSRSGITQILPASEFVYRLFVLGLLLVPSTPTARMCVRLHYSYSRPRSVCVCEFQQFCGPNLQNCKHRAKICLKRLSSHNKRPSWVPSERHAFHVRSCTSAGLHHYSPSSGCDGYSDTKTPH